MWTHSIPGFAVLSHRRRAAPPLAPLRAVLVAICVLVCSPKVEAKPGTHARGAFPVNMNGPSGVGSSDLRLVEGRAHACHADTDCVIVSGCCGSARGAAHKWDTIAPEREGCGCGRPTMVMPGERQHRAVCSNHTCLMTESAPYTPHPEPPRLYFEPEEVTEGSADFAYRFMRSRQTTVRRCFEKEVAKGSTLRGAVTIRFEVNTRGDVVRARVSDGTLKNDSVYKCIISTIRRWKFPKPNGGASVEVAGRYVWPG